MFWSVFFGVIAAVIALCLIGVVFKAVTQEPEFCLAVFAMVSFVFGPIILLFVFLR